MSSQYILINITIAFSLAQIDPNFTLSPLMSKTSKSYTLMVVSSGNALKSAMVMIVRVHRMPNSDRVTRYLVAPSS